MIARLGYSIATPNQANRNSGLVEDSFMTGKLPTTVTRAAEIVSLNPATLEELARFPIATADDVNAAVARARAAQPSAAALSCRKRPRYILKVRRALYDHKEELCRIISDETGKPEFEALTTEVFMVSDLMSHFAMKSEKLLRHKRFTLAVFRNKRSLISREPLGVVGVISPWNFPFSIPVGEIVMALMAGDTVVLKSSEHTPLVGVAIKRLSAAAGFPECVLEVVHGEGSK